VWRFVASNGVSGGSCRGGWAPRSAGRVPTCARADKEPCPRADAHGPLARDQCHIEGVDRGPLEVRTVLDDLAGMVVRGPLIFSSICSISGTEMRKALSMAANFAPGSRPTC
jgi:hypothetical protein